MSPVRDEVTGASRDAKDLGGARRIHQERVERLPWCSQESRLTPAGLAFLITAPSFCEMLLLTWRQSFLVVVGLATSFPVRPRHGATPRCRCRSRGGVWPGGSEEPRSGRAAASTWYGDFSAARPCLSTRGDCMESVKRSLRTVSSSGKKKKKRQMKTF